MSAVLDKRQQRGSRPPARPCHVTARHVGEVVQHGDVWPWHRETDGGEVGGLDAAGGQRGSDRAAGKAGIVLYPAEALLGGRKDNFLITDETNRAFVQRMVDAEAPHGYASLAALRFR